MAAGGSIGSGRMRLYGIYCTSALSGSFRGEDVGGGRQNFSGVVPVRNQSRDNLKERREDRSVEGHVVFHIVLPVLCGQSQTNEYSFMGRETGNESFQKVFCCICPVAGLRRQLHAALYKICFGS